MICTSTPFMKTIAYLNVLISTWKKYSYWIMTSDTFSLSIKYLIDIQRLSIHPSVINRMNIHITLFHHIFLRSIILVIRISLVIVYSCTAVITLSESIVQFSNEVCIFNKQIHPFINPFCKHMEMEDGHELYFVRSGKITHP